jgi:hypothetical protein
VGNQDLAQRLNRQEVASEQETCKKPTKTSLPRRRKPAVRIARQRVRQAPELQENSGTEKRGRKDSRRRDDSKIAENALTTIRTRLKVRAVITNEY